ncbi:IPTL-CTERM sorting domain-containing protein [Brevundimonas sp.]|uniref:IPTL-CTERM sorting domain-containing protein n=1 Tax=Brevundimonas sp. TaxID=1871086 RepID=UPI002ED8A9D9
MRTIAAALALATALFAGQAAAQNIDTTAAANGSFGIFGVPNSATYGQTITIPAGETQLFSFGFVMKNVPSTVVFRGEVYLWDDANNRATGPALYESAARSTTGATAQLITFSPPGGLTVTPGQKYVIFATTSRDQAGASGVGNWAASSSNPYAGGTAVFINNSTNTADWTSGTWAVNTSTDFGFVANFNAPPAPVPTLSEWAMILFGLALAGGAVVMVQRRRLAA